MQKQHVAGKGGGPGIEGNFWFLEQSKIRSGRYSDHWTPFQPPNNHHT
jgi:hypothetical protein